MFFFTNFVKNYAINQRLMWYPASTRPLSSQKAQTNKQLHIMKILVLAIAAIAALNAPAQVADRVERMMFDHLEVGATIGSTGLGIEAAMPCTKYLRIRAGMEFMPRFAVPMSFDIASYRDNSTQQTEFSKLQDMMYKISGFEVDQKADMRAKPTMVNAKVMVDIYPWVDNRHWRLTAGFYWGSRRVATAANTMEEMTSMLAIGQFNNMHDYFVNEEYMDKPLLGDNYIDPEMGDQMRDKFSEYGRVGVHVGDFRDGTPYIMEPGTDGVVRARVYVNRFKPYLGVGYDSAVTKDGKLTIGFDAGCLFWGGTPRIYTHEGVNLAKDVVNIKGKVGDYVDMMKSFKVYPALNFRIAYNIF